MPIFKAAINRTIGQIYQLIKMNLNKGIFINILAICCLSACKKSFLDIPTKSDLTRQEYVKDLATTKDYMNGIYVTFAKELYTAANSVYPSIIADDIKPVDGGSMLIPHYKWSQISGEINSADFNINAFWQTAYQAIRSSSFVIEKANQYKSEAPALADDITGQALAVRGFTHFLLVNMFAQPYNFTSDASHPGIPYITDYDWTQPVHGRSTVAEVYKMIIDDLNKALPLFSSTGFDQTVLNRHAAKALLAKVNLFKQDFATAARLAREVVVSVPAMTSNYPAKLFTNEDTEALFALPPSSDSYFTFYAGLYFSDNFWLQFIATQDVADVLNEYPDDLRRAWVANVAGNWQIKKFPAGVDPNYPVAVGSYYQPVIRSSELYLIAAESYAKVNKEDSARYYLDAIKKRSIPTVEASTATGVALLDSIYKERRRELAFEGGRIFDLLRWKKEIVRKDVSNSAPVQLPYPNNKAIAPLPSLDVKMSALPQNPGY